MFEINDPVLDVHGDGRSLLIILIGFMAISSVLFSFSCSVFSRDVKVGDEVTVTANTPIGRTIPDYGTYLTMEDMGSHEAANLLFTDGSIFMIYVDNRLEVLSIVEIPENVKHTFPSEAQREIKHMVKVSVISGVEAGKEGWISDIQLRTFR